MRARMVADILRLLADGHNVRQGALREELELLSEAALQELVSQLRLLHEHKDNAERRARDARRGIIR